MLTKGSSSPPRTLKNRFKDWGITRRQAALTPAALETVSQLFHTTTDDDDTIAHTLTTGHCSFSSTGPRSSPSACWRRRNVDTEQREEHRQQTGLAVTEPLRDSGQNYGRNYLTTTLRLQGRRARKDDVGAELRQQDPDSTSDEQSLSTLALITYGASTAVIN